MPWKLDRTAYLHKGRCHGSADRDCTKPGGLGQDDNDRRTDNLIKFSGGGLFEIHRRLTHRPVRGACLPFSHEQGPLVVAPVFLGVIKKTCPTLIWGRNMAHDVCEIFHVFLQYYVKEVWNVYRLKKKVVLFVFYKIFYIFATTLQRIMSLKKHNNYSYSFCVSGMSGLALPKNS